MAVEALGSAPRTRVAPWNDPVIRGWVFQIVVVGARRLALPGISSPTPSRISHRQKIASGFHYLEREAGFEIGDTMIAYSPASTYARAIFVGLLNTLKVSVLGVFLATILGTMIGVGRLSPNWLLAKICAWYVEAFRNVPLLLWLFLFYKLISEAFPGPRQAIGAFWNSVFLSNRGLYFPVPLADPIHKWMGIALLLGIAGAWVLHRWARKRQDATGQPFPSISAGFGLALGLPLLVWLIGGAPHHLSWPELKGFNFEGGTVIQPEFTALLVGLVLYTSAFIAEIVRSGILALHKGQSEAAMALGLSRGQAMRLVLLPQALRVIVPPMTSQYLNITKNSSLAIAIGYPDLVASINVTINQTGQAIENIAAHHGRLPVGQPVDLGLHELVQQTHRPEGALSHDRRSPVGERPQLAPPIDETGPLGWARKNLFSSWLQRHHHGRADRGHRLDPVVVPRMGGLHRQLHRRDRRRVPRRRRLLGADPREVPLIFFGTFPYEQQWRPLFAVVAMLAMLITIGRPAHVELAAADHLGPRLVHHLPADVRPAPHPAQPVPVRRPGRRR